MLAKRYSGNQHSRRDGEDLQSTLGDCSTARRNKLSFWTSCGLLRSLLPMPVMDRSSDGEKLH